MQQQSPRAFGILVGIFIFAKSSVRAQRMQYYALLIVLTKLQYLQCSQYLQYCNNYCCFDFTEQPVSIYIQLKLVLVYTRRIFHCTLKTFRRRNRYKMARHFIYTHPSLPPQNRTSSSSSLSPTPQEKA